jgi:hypothetical protein
MARAQNHLRRLYTLFLLQHPPAPVALPADTVPLLPTLASELQLPSYIRRSRLVHIQKISAIFALNRTRSAAKGTELNYFVAVIITSHRIFTFPETCYIERTNSNGTARNVSKSRFYLISRAPPKYFSQQKARQVESFLPRLEGGYTIGCITG